MTTSSQPPRCSTASAGRPPPTSRPPREHLAAASDGRFLYAVGGRDLSPAKNSRRARALSTRRPNRWERLPDMPTARGGLGAAIAGGRIFAIGGETATDVLGKVESFDLRREVVVQRPRDAHSTPRAHGRRDRPHRLRARRRHPARPRDCGGDGGGARQGGLSCGRRGIATSGAPWVQVKRCPARTRPRDSQLAARGPGRRPPSVRRLHGAARASCCDSGAPAPSWCGSSESRTAAERTSPGR